MIQKKYFTPLSLIRVIDYFVKSRISYGLCCFLNNVAMMDKLDDLLMRHLRGIFGLPRNTSGQRLRLVIGEPKIACRLAVRLLKNWHKYKIHFGEYPTFYEKTLKKYFAEGELYPEKGNTPNFYEIKFRLLNNNLREMSKQSLGLIIRNDHREFLKRSVFNWSDLRNFYIIRYFTGTTKGTCSRLFPLCGCGAENTPEHGANECTRALKDRSLIMSKFDSLFNECGLVKKSNVYDYLREVFFCVEKVPAKILRKLVELMKSTIREIIINDSSVDSRYINQVDDPIQPDVDIDKDVSFECNLSDLNDESTCD